MLRWLHLFKNDYIGLSFVGIIVFVVQENTIHGYAVDEVAI